MRFRDGVKIFLIVVAAMLVTPSWIRIVPTPIQDAAIEYVEPEARFIGGAELWFEPSTAPVILAEERV